MTSVRRLLPFAAFAVLATVWSAVNIGLHNAAAQHHRTIDAIELANVNARQLAAGRPLLLPMNPSYYGMGWAAEWRTLAPGLLLLAGAAVFAALLRRSVRGPWWVAALVAPAFTAGFASMKQAWAYGAAGAGTTAYATPLLLARGPGLVFPHYTFPSWLVPAMAAMGVLLVLLPAVCVRRAPDVRAVSRANAGGAAALGVVAASLFLAVELLVAEWSQVPWRGPAGGGIIVVAVALALPADRWRAVPWLVVAAGAVVAGTTGVSAAQLAAAAGYGALAVAGGAIVLTPWSAVRARLNGRRAVLAMQI
jgi:hypothetical protein